MSDQSLHNPDLTHPRYPLIEYASDSLHAASGRPLDQVTIDALERNELTPADLQVSAETLRQQAEIAQQAGFTQLAQNLTRAAELTAVPNEELLQMYDRLRPGRATYDELLELATRLAEHYQAHENATFVREAAEVYLARKLVKVNL